LLFGVPIVNPTGLYSLNELNNSGTPVTVTSNQVRYIYNGPGAARAFGNPFGDVPRNYLRGPAINQLNLGFFKTTRIMENIRLQFRAELYNALNHPQPGFGVTRASSVPDFQVENAGVFFLDYSQIELARRVVQFGLRLVF
jgi:hypothetical protein